MFQQSDSMIQRLLRNPGFCIVLFTLVVAFPWSSIQGQTYLGGKPCLNKGPNAVVQCKGWVRCTFPSVFTPSATIHGQEQGEDCSLGVGCVLAKCWALIKSREHNSVCRSECEGMHAALIGGHDRSSTNADFCLRFPPITPITR